MGGARSSLPRLAFVAVAAGTFAAWPHALRLDAVTGAFVLVVLSVSLSIAASGAPNALTVTAGALSAFIATLLHPVSAPLAGGVLVALAYAERSTRVRGREARLLHLGFALAAGAVAGALSAARLPPSLAVRLVVIAVSAVAIALPMLIEADDSMAHVLESMARQTSEPVCAALLRAACLRRGLDDEGFDRVTNRRLGRTWRALLRLSEVRVRLERLPVAALATGTATAAVKERVDERIGAHVVALSRAYAAGDAAVAAAIGFDDRALEGAESMGEALEETTRALVELE